MSDKDNLTYIPGFGLVVAGKRISGSVKGELKGREKPLGSPPTELTLPMGDYIKWGNNDMLPQEMIDDINASTVVKPAITMLSSMLYGAGVGVQLVDEADSSAQWIAPRTFREFYKKSAAHRFIKMLFVDLIGLGIGHVQISLNMKGDRINLISAHHTRARMVRLGKKDATGTIKKAFINADYGRSGYYNPENTRELLVIDNQYHPADWLRNYIANGGTARHFLCSIRHVSTAAENYYPAPDWNAARESKVMSLAKNILKMKDYYLQHMMNLKYHIEFHPDYFASRFGAQWNAADSEGKIALIQEEVDRIDTFFSGAEGGNVFASQMLTKIVGNEFASSVKISEFKQVFNDGVHVEDLQETAQHQLFATGLHASIFGSGAKTGLSGNGSENRVVYNQRVAMGQYYRDEVCALFELWRDYNAIPNSEMWDFSFRNFPEVATADELPPRTRDLGGDNEPEGR